MNIRAYGLFIELDLVHECYAKIGCLPYFERSLVHTGHYFTVRFKYWRELSMSHFSIYVYPFFRNYEPSFFSIQFYSLMSLYTSELLSRKRFFYLKENYYFIPFYTNSIL